jgi:hypothetical protein
MVRLNLFLSDNGMVRIRVRTSGFGAKWTFAKHRRLLRARNGHRSIATLRDHSFTKSFVCTDCLFSRSTKLPLKLSNKTMTEGTRAQALAASIALKKNLMVGVRLSPT